MMMCCNANRAELTVRISGRETGLGRGASASCNVRRTRNAYRLLSFHSLWVQFVSLPKMRHSLANVIARS